MSLKVLVENAKKAAPALESVPDAKAVVLLREVFSQISRQVEEAKDGVVVIAGLGKFKVKVGEKEKDGQTSATRRVLFKATGAGEGKLAGKGGKGGGKAGKAGKSDSAGADMSAVAGKAGKGGKAGKAGKAGKGGKAGKAGKGGKANKAKAD